MKFLPIQQSVKKFCQIQFVRDVLTLQVGGIFAMGIGIAQSIIIANLLGIHEFGIYAIILAFTGMLSIPTNLGQQQAFMTFFAEAYGKKDAKMMKGIIKYYLQITLVSACMLLCLIAIVPLLSNVLYSEINIGHIAQIALLGKIAGITHGLFIGMLQTVRHIRHLTILENCSLIIQLIFTVVLLIAGMGVKGIFLASVISNVIMLLLYVKAYLPLRNSLMIPGILNSWKESFKTKEYCKQGLWIAMDKNIGNMFPQSMLFILSLFASPSIVGITQLGLRLGYMPGNLSLPSAGRMATTVLPSNITRGANHLRKICATIIKHALAYHAAISIGGLIVLPPLVLLFYGLEFADVIEPMAWIILIRLISGLNVLNTPLLRMYGKSHLSALWSFINLPIVLSILIVLLRIMPPLQAFVFVILCRFIINLWISWYVFFRLIPQKT